MRSRYPTKSAVLTMLPNAQLVVDPFYAEVLVMPMWWSFGLVGAVPVAGRSA